MHWKYWLKLIGLGLFVWLMTQLDWPQLGQLARTLDPVYLAAYAATFALMLLLRSLRLRIALSRTNHTLSFKNCYAATVEPAFLGIVTPGRLGEFSRIGYLRAHDVPLPNAIVIVMLERLVDVSLLLIVGTTGLIYIFSPDINPLVLSTVITGSLLTLWGLLHRSIDVLNFLQKRLGWLSRWEPNRLRDRRHELGASVRNVLQHSVQPMFTIGLCCIALNFLQVFLLAKAFHFQTGYLVIIFSYSAATLVSLLPISFGGLGTREATYIVIMRQIGITQEEALLFSLTDGIVFSVLLLFILIVPLWFANLRITKSKPTDTQ